MRNLDKLARAILCAGFIAMVIFLKTVEVADAAVLEGDREANKIEYKSEDLRDPFQEEKIEIQEEPQEQVETGPLPSLQVQGIVWGGAFPQAVINNKVVRVGDTIEGVRITNIGKGSVTVFFGNRNYNLSIISPIGSKDTKKNPRGGKDE